MNPKHLVIAAVVLAATSSVISRAHSAGTERVEISSPIFPQTSVLYAQEGAKFPATLAGEEALVHAAALTFEKLLTECAKTDSTITLSTGAPLTSEQLESNYRQVAACAYEKYTVKPYWIPKLIDDVAICETELGADWHLLSEADLGAFTEAEFQFIADTLTGTAGATGASFPFYFSSRVFIRGTDGSIKLGDIAPGASPRVTPLTATGEQLKLHYEGGTALRCIRRTPV